MKVSFGMAVKVGVPVERTSNEMSDSVSVTLPEVDRDGTRRRHFRSSFEGPFTREKFCGPELLIHLNFLSTVQEREEIFILHPFFFILHP